MDLQLGVRIVAAAVVSYLVGGISWAYIIGKRFYGIDVRLHGSGNLGATNVFRTLGAKAAIATLVLDVAKGAAAVGFAWWLVPVATYGETAHTWAMIAATMAAILGHSYSPYIGFRGGKGIATAAGRTAGAHSVRLAVSARHIHHRRCVLANRVAGLGDGCDRLPAALPCVLLRELGDSRVRLCCRQPCRLAAPGQHRAHSARRRA